MGQNTKHSVASEDRSLIIRSDWRVGPRTAAWDRLWRLMLSGLDARPIEDAKEQPGWEGTDA